MFSHGWYNFTMPRLQGGISFIHLKVRVMNHLQNTVLIMQKINSWASFIFCLCHQSSIVNRDGGYTFST